MKLTCRRPIFIVLAVVVTLAVGARLAWSPGLLWLAKYQAIKTCANTQDAEFFNTVLSPQVKFIRPGDSEGQRVAAELDGYQFSLPSPEYQTDKTRPQRYIDFSSDKLKVRCFGVLSFTEEFAKVADKTSVSEYFRKTDPFVILVDSFNATPADIQAQKTHDDLTKHMMLLYIKAELTTVGSEKLWERIDTGKREGIISGDVSCVFIGVEIYLPESKEFAGIWILPKEGAQMDDVYRAIAQLNISKIDGSDGMLQNDEAIPPGGCSREPAVPMSPPADLRTSNSGLTIKRVRDATGNLPEFPKIDVSVPNRFLNDLKLSPLWKVEKERDGSFVAMARSISPDSPFDDTGRVFLFELMASVDKNLPKDYRIHNRYLEGGKTFSSFRVTVVFRKPDVTRMALGESGQKTTLAMFESFEGTIGPNSSSDLAIKLSSQHEVYVILHEQGADPERRTTFAKVLPILRELADIGGAPEAYRVEERYSAFFNLFFKLPLKDHDIKRFAGLQDRDTFYGYFRAKPDASYNGINIKISHPIYCPVEGTRKYSRLEKAEYLGTPYQEKDILFFLIEDNAVYLSGDYDKRFGTFTGKESFDGTLEVLNDKGTVLLRITDKFKGWQR